MIRKKTLTSFQVKTNFKIIKLNNFQNAYVSGDNSKEKKWSQLFLLIFVKFSLFCWMHFTVSTNKINIKLLMLVIFCIEIMPLFSPRKGEFAVVRQNLLAELIKNSR